MKRTKKTTSKKPPLGSGARFRQLESKLRNRKGKGGKKIKNPAALAAWIGRRKYGSERFAQLSAHSRKAMKKAMK